MNNLKSRPYFRHFVVEVECSFEEANSLKWIEEKANLLINKLGIRTLKKIEHLFKPQGISQIYIISSSHMAIHTWPENNYIHIELLTCSTNHQFDKFKDSVNEVFQNFKYHITELKY